MKTRPRLTAKVQWVLVMLLALHLAGCAQHDAAEPPFSSTAALAVAQAHLGDRQAALLSVTAYEGNLTDYRVEWLRQRGLLATEDRALLDGASPGWLLEYALPPLRARTPDTLLLQVTPDEVREHLTPGRALMGEAHDLIRRGPRDICFTRDTNPYEDLALLGAVADSTQVASKLAADSRLQEFLPDIDSFLLRLTGAGAGYGVMPQYWCYEHQRMWHGVASNRSGGSFHGYFSLEGEPLRTLDWREGAQLVTQEIQEHYVNRLSMETVRHEIMFEVGSQMGWLSVNSRMSGGGREAVLRELVDPGGTVVDSLHGTSNRAMHVSLPAPGTWSLHYSYNTTLPLAEHRLDLTVQTYGA